MKEPQSTDLLSALPHTRPHRRSDKRPASPQGGLASEAKAGSARAKAPSRKAASRSKATTRKSSSPRQPAVRSSRPSASRLRQPAQPRGTPATGAARSTQARKSPPSATEIVGTAVGAAAELAEIGLTLGTRALRRTLSRLPRP